MPVHEAQLLTYLKLTGKQVGLHINFNVPLLKRWNSSAYFRFGQYQLGYKKRFGKHREDGVTEYTEGCKLFWFNYLRKYKEKNYPVFLCVNQKKEQPGTYMMKRGSQKRENKSLSITALLNVVRSGFLNLKSSIKSRKVSLVDCLASALAMFSLKFPSLLANN